ncbi:hypothetical protein ACP3VS_21080 [Lysinibacillus sp. VIII_CA]|uniref:hypothetical protein n=1 Tax=Lysinibacillus sp. VIII_CA TaxID=3417452 RepID=UPI003CE9FE01
MDVVVDKYERQAGHYGEFEYIYKVHKVPGGRVIKTFHVPHSYDSEEMLEYEERVRKEIHEYLEKHDYKAIQKF